MRISDEIVRKSIQFACHKTGCLELANVPFEWSRRLRTTMGYAYVTYKRSGFDVTYSFSIKLSSQIFETASEREQVETVIHETCHLIDRYNHYVINRRTDKPPGSHGPKWKSLMRQCGLKPKRCHNLPVKRNSPVRRYETLCKCRAHHITGQRLSKIIKRERSYVCNHCSAHIIPTEEALSSYLNR